MPRPRSVISPQLPSRAKLKVEAEPEPWKPRPGLAYRLRITDESPFGGFEIPTYSDDEFELELMRDEHTAAGVNSVIEVAFAYGYKAPAVKPVTVADLSHDHLAIQGPDNCWRIKPEGQERIYRSLGL